MVEDHGLRGYLTKLWPSFMGRLPLTLYPDQPLKRPVAMWASVPAAQTKLGSIIYFFSVDCISAVAPLMQIQSQTVRFALGPIKQTKWSL